MNLKLPSLVKGIDHIILMCNSADEDMNRFQKLFCLPDYIPVQKHDFFFSGMLRINNLDIEFLSFPKHVITEPFIYGLALSSSLDLESTMDELLKKSIPITTPIDLKIDLASEQTSHLKMVCLKGFLKDEISLPYPPLFLLKHKWSRNALARVVNWAHNSVMHSKWITPSFGSSMLSLFYLDEFTSDLRRERKKNSTAPPQYNKHSIKGVHSIQVKTNSYLWNELIGDGHFNDGPNISINYSNENCLGNITLIIDAEEPQEPISFGKVIFNFIK